MRNVIANRNLSTGVITFVNQTFLEAQITALMNDGSSYTVDSPHECQVASAKDSSGNVIAWAPGAYTLEAVSSTCGVTDCKRVGIETQYDPTNGELYYPMPPQGGTFFGTSTTNTCTGNKCSQCSFTYTPDGKHITGCKCTEGPGTCDHSISSTATT